MSSTGKPEDGIVQPLTVPITGSQPERKNAVADAECEPDDPDEVAQDGRT